MSNPIYTYVLFYTNVSGIKIKLGVFDYLSAAKDKILSFSRSNFIPIRHSFHVLLFRDGIHFKTNYYFYDHVNDLVRNLVPEVQP